MVEYDLPKVGAEGSIPFSRSSVGVRLVLRKVGLYRHLITKPKYAAELE